MKFATLKHPTKRDGVLHLVEQKLRRAIDVSDIAPTLQYALEHWTSLEGKLLDESESDRKSVV